MDKIKQKFDSNKILEVLPSKYYIISPDSKVIVQSNDPAVEENESKCYSYFYGESAPCDESEGNCICRQTLKKGNFSSIIEKSEGTQKKFYKVRYSILDADNIIVSFENISDEFQIRKELKINTKRLERAENLADFGYWEFNRDDKIMIVSKGTMKIYGIHSSTLSLEDAKSYPLKRYRKKLDKELEDLINFGKPYNIKFKIKRKIDGEIRCIHSIAEYREDKKMVFGVIHDITENEKTNIARLESENNLKHLFKNMNSAFAFHKIVTDKKGKPVDYIFLDVNDKFEELTGLKRNNILNKRVLEVLPNTEEFWIDRYGKVAMTGKPVTFTDYSSEIDKHFEVSAYSPKKNYFAVTFSDVTDRIKSETALKESYEDLKLAQKIADVGNWNYNPETKITNWSEQMYDIFKRTHEEGPFNFSDYKEIFDKEYFNLFANNFLSAIREGKPFDIQLKLNDSKGDIKWIKCICQPTQWTNSGSFLLRGTVQDITSIKIAQEELANTNQLLKTVIDNIPDAIYMKDTNFRKLIANKGDAVHSGVDDVSKIIGKTDYDLYPKEIADIYTADDRKVIEKGEPVINREEILPLGDKIRWVLTSKFPLKNAKRQIIGLVGIGRDITELKESQSKLNLLQHTIHQTPLPVVITDVNGDIEYVNPGFTKVTGYNYNEVIGKNPSLLRSDLHDDNFYKKLWKTISSGKNWNGEFYNRKKDGTFYWENAVIAPIVDENGEIKHYVAIKEDITEKKRIIEDLKIAKEKAEESNRLKNVFLTNLSHEIRTPLNGILGFTDIICSGLTDKKKLEYFGEIIEKSGRRLIKVIDDIVDISMIQSNQVKINKTVFNLNDVIEELFDLYKDLYRNKLSEIDFSVKFCENKETCTINSDKSKMRQVLSNCLDNAFKFTKSGYIKFGYFDSSDKKITLFVEDSGIGIEKEKKKLIFEPFRQVEEGDSRRYEGPGLGLAISAAIMEKLGGKIKIKSHKESGSVFYLKFRR